MTRLAFFVIFLVPLFTNCSNKDQVEKRSATFKSFEISYTNGWTKSFSFVVDSSRIYFSPKKSDTTYYGILPDTIFDVFDATFLKIQSDENIKSKNNGCVDCSVVAIKIISDSDTTRIQQTGNLDNVFYPLIRKLQRFIDSSKHQIIHAAIWLDTKSIVTPPPTKIDETKFKPPIIGKKSGR